MGRTICCLPQWALLRQSPSSAGRHPFRNGSLSPLSWLMVCDLKVLPVGLCRYNLRRSRVPEAAARASGPSFVKLWMAEAPLKNTE